MRMTNWSRVMPALFTRISILPNCAMTALKTALICSSSATSSPNAAAWPPAAVISLTTSSSFSRLRAATATAAPAFARRSAQARPIPCEAPVTKATRPDRVIPRLLKIAAEDYSEETARLRALFGTGRSRGLRRCRYHLIVALVHIDNRSPNDAGLGFRVQMNGQRERSEIREVLANADLRQKDGRRLCRNTFEMHQAACVGVEIQVALEQSNAPSPRL